MSRVAAVIQARMGSTRLPGKVLRPLAGKPLLWHILYRLSLSKVVDDIIVATSTHEGDTPVAEYALEWGAQVVRGPQDDVLKRFALAAELTNPEYIVRIVGDAPLIDPELIDSQVTLLRRAKADFVRLKPGTPCIHDGVDPFSRRALNFLLREARDEPVAREHVTGFLKAHPDRIKTICVDLPEAYQFAGARVSVDTPADLAFLEQLYVLTGAEPGKASLPQITALLRRHPELTAVNAHVRQKTATQGSGTVLIRCDGGAGIGLGHVRRMLGLANRLRDHEGLGVIFALERDDVAASLIEAADFRVERLAEGAEMDSALMNLCALHRPLAVVCDLRGELSPEVLEQVRGENIRIVCYDDAGPRRLTADLAVYPPSEHARVLDWRGFSGQLVIGWDHALLGPEFPCEPLSNESGTPLRVLCAMGGADPERWLEPVTVTVLQTLRARAPDFLLTTVVGPGFADGEALSQRLAALDRRVRPAYCPGSMPALFESSDLAVLAFGVSCFEVAHCGVPAIHICRDAAALETASMFAEANIAKVIDATQGLYQGAVSAQVAALIQDAGKRAEMGARARRLVDGRGAERLAARIARLAANQVDNPDGPEAVSPATNSAA